MKVLYDDQAFTMQHIGGVSKGICSILSQMPDEIEMSFGVDRCNNVYLKESGLIPDLRPAEIDWIDTKAKYYFPGLGTLYRLISRHGLIRSAEYCNRRKSVQMLKEGGYDVFHPTFFNDYFLPYLQGRPFVLTIHDMMPELFPDYFGKNDMQVLAKRKLAPLAAAIAVPSQNTKEDVMRFLNVPEEKITVIHRGGPAVEDIAGESPCPYPYFLFVGTRGQYKNFWGLVNDFGSFHPSCPEVKLLCVGAPFTKGEVEELGRRGLSDTVMRVAANDDQLKVYYAHALAFIFPSRYEGFGLPVLESFAYGCPLLLNRQSCFPEVAGDAALYFESDGGESALPELMKLVMAWTQDERRDWVAKGRERLSLFSWKRAAEKYAKLYRSLV